MNETKQLSRRNFMQAAIWGIGGLIGIGFGVPAVAYVVGPSLKTQQTQTWMRLGPTTKVELGTPTLFTFTIQTQTGWIVNSEEVSVYVLSNDGRTYIAMSNICTHLGCRVSWHANLGHYVSPCHDGHFGLLGDNVSGPPPRPLDEFAARLEEGRLWIQLPPFRRNT